MPSRRERNFSWVFCLSFMVAHSTSTAATGLFASLASMVSRRVVALTGTAESAGKAGVSLAAATDLASRGGDRWLDGLGDGCCPSVRMVVMPNQQHGNGNRYCHARHQLQIRGYQKPSQQRRERRDA